jgi:uncharacterized protein (DUF2141 family)
MSPISYPNQVSSNTLVANERVIQLVEGEATPLWFNYQDDSATITDGGLLGMTFVRQNGQSDLTSTYFTGSLSISGKVIKTKTTTGLKAGMYYLTIMAGINGNKGVVKAIWVEVIKKSGVGVRPPLLVAEERWRMQEGALQPFRFTLPGKPTITDGGTLAFYFYKGNTDKAGATNYFTGSNSIDQANYQIITKITGTGLKAGRYCASVFATINGYVRCAGLILVDVERKSGR